MYYKIQKSLGNISAILVDTIPQSGVCVEFKNFGLWSQEASIVVYQDGRNDDLHINSWSFPFVFNNIRVSRGSDIFGGRYLYEISFEAIAPDGSVQSIESKTLYGDKESMVVEYFYSMLYHLSCCEDTKQFKELYKCIIDNQWFDKHHSRKEAINVLSFIEAFTPKLDRVEDTTYIAGLKQKMSVKFKMAQEIVAESSCPGQE